MASVTFSLSVDTRLARWGIRLAAFLAPVIGRRGAIRLAEAAVTKGIRYRVGRGRWTRMTGLHVSLMEQDVPEGPDTPTDAVPADWVPPTTPDTDDGTEEEEDGA